jgi:predicted RNA binding protein YcfA (HicA-like mRNA interferase family)
MAKLPSINYRQVIAALLRLGFRVVRQKGSHVRLEKNLDNTVLKITVPAHNPIKRSTLGHILKQANISLDEFLESL